MDSNSKLNPMLIRAQSESAINNITSCNEELQKLKNSIQAFVDDTSIVSEAFDLLKNYASAIPGTIDKMIEHNCKDIEDYRTLAASVGDEVLIGALIIDSKNRHYKLWWESKEKADMYRSRAQTAVNYSMQSMFQGLANYYNELAQMHHQLYVYWRTKEEKYDRIEGETAGLFNRDNPMINIEDINITNLIRIGGYYVIYKNNVYDFYKKKILEYDEWVYSESYSYIDKDGNVITDTWNISDEEFTDKYGLSLEEVKEICYRYNPKLVEKGFPEAIISAAFDNSLNPKVLLATLGGEQNWCRDGGYDKAFGVGPGGKPNSYDDEDIGGVKEAALTYKNLYEEGKEQFDRGSEKELHVNYDTKSNQETKAIFGEHTDEWLALNPDYARYMREGLYIMPVNAAMYAKLRYTPWVDFPPNHSKPLATWHSIYTKLGSN